MNTVNEITLLVDDLAGHWTEPVLGILKAGGVPSVSVDMELEAWRILRKLLHSEFRRQSAFRFPTLRFLGTMMEQVLFKAALFVAVKFEPRLVSYAFERRIRQLAGERRSTVAEQRLYAQLTRQPALRGAFKLPSRSDFTPRLRTSAI